MNVQGDEPDIDIEDIKNLDIKMKQNSSSIGTLAAKIEKEEMYKMKMWSKLKLKKNLIKILFH